MRHCGIPAVLKNALRKSKESITVIRNSKMMAAIMFQGPPILKVGGSLGPHFLVLDPSLSQVIMK